MRDHKDQRPVADLILFLESVKLVVIHHMYNLPHHTVSVQRSCMNWICVRVKTWTETIWWGPAVKESRRGGSAGWLSTWCQDIRAGVCVQKVGDCCKTLHAEPYFYFFSLTWKGDCQKMTWKWKPEYYSWCTTFYFHVLQDIKTRICTKIKSQCLSDYIN